MRNGYLLLTEINTNLQLNNIIAYIGIKEVLDFKNKY